MKKTEMGITPKLEKIILKCQELKEKYNIDYPSKAKKLIDKFSREIQENNMIEQCEDQDFAMQLCAVNELRWEPETEFEKTEMTHDLFKLSTDYEHLWGLIHTGHKIPGWIYNDRHDSDGTWDLVEIKNMYSHSFGADDYCIGTRGIHYTGMPFKEGFIETCKTYNLHFIKPNNKHVPYR